MNIINTNLWRSYVNEQLDMHKQLYVSAAVLGAFIYKSKRPASNSLALWNSSIFEAKSVFSKMSPDKQAELVRHVVIKLPFTFTRKISVADMLNLFDASGSVSHILGFLSCTSQGFPVYNDIVAHSQMVANYITCSFQNMLKSHFPEHVHIINGECYASAGLLLALAVNDVDHWKYINSAEVKELRTIDVLEPGWDISILEREGNAWCTFAINTRRSVLKDFDMHPNCICSNINTSTRQELNRLHAMGTQVSHLVTVFDIPYVISSMKTSLCEIETVDILNKLLV